MRFLSSPTSAPPLQRLLAGALALLMAVASAGGQSSSSAPSSPNSSAQRHSSSTTKTTTAKKTTKPGARGRRTANRSSKASRAARTARIRQAFVASTELRPMAQQLATLRTPAAYEGVSKYARLHKGEAAAAAYLALGHAYLLDRRFVDAETNLHLARQAGEDLADYADFLGAEADHEAGNEAAAESLLQGFSGRYPDSIFNAQAPELEASVLLAVGNAVAAQQVLAQAAGTAAAS